jgi:hypothetical protein
VAGARDAEAAPHQHAGPRHARLLDGGQRPGAVTHDRRGLGLRADDEAGLVDQVHDRQAEGVGEVDEAGLLVGAVRGHPAAVDPRVAGEHGDRAAAQPGEGGDGSGGVQPAELEDRAASKTDRQAGRGRRTASAARAAPASAGLVPVGGRSRLRPAGAASVCGR